MAVALPLYRMKISVLHKVFVVLVVLALIGVGGIGCGDSREKVQDSFVTDPNGGSSSSDEVSIQGGTQFEGSLSSVDSQEYQIIAASDFSGRLIEPPKIKMTLKISENGFVEQGEIVIRGRDRVNGTADDFMTYRASCSAKEGKHCGTFLNGNLEIRLFDGVGFVEFRANSKNQNEFSGPIRIDGHPRHLGNIDLKTDQLKNKEDILI